MGVRLVSGAPGGAPLAAPRRAALPWSAMALATLSPARRAAHAVVLRTLAEGAYADRALHGEARGLEPRDRALAKQLAFGTVQRRLTLDHVIAAPRRPRRSSRACAPRCSSGSSSCCSSTASPRTPRSARPSSWPSPAPATGSSTPCCAASSARASSCPPTRRPRAPSIRHSHPRWIVDLWWDWLGPDETRALLAADNEPAELALRVNALVDYDLDDVPGRREGETIVVDGPFDALAHPGYAAGAFTPQSRASQLVARAARAGARRARARPVRGARRQDDAPRGAHGGHGRGRGGRAPPPARPRAAGHRARACGPPTSRVVTADAKDYDGAGRFDRVLLDPPCSGLGTLRSHPDLRWRTSPEAIERLAAEQDALLASARRALAPGGRSSTRSAPSRRARSGW